MEEPSTEKSALLPKGNAVAYGDGSGSGGELLVEDSETSRASARLEYVRQLSQRMIDSVRSVIQEHTCKLLSSSIPVKVEI